MCIQKDKISLNYKKQNPYHIHLGLIFIPKETYKCVSVYASKIFHIILLFFIEKKIRL